MTRIGMFILGLAGCCVAQEQPSQAWDRRAFEERGVTVHLTYTAETFSLLKGGTGSGRAMEYLGSFMPALEVDLTRLGVGRGQFFVSGQSLHGRSINNDRVGAAQSLSNLDSDRFGKFIEAWYGDSYFDGKLRVKAGRQYADADFGVVENGADFLNSSYGLIPTTPMPTYPAPTLGASAWMAATSWMSGGVGVYQGGFTILEAKLEPFGKTAASHGSYRVGAWRQSLDHNRGMYVAGDHWFMRSRSGADRGPGVFFQWGRTPADRNAISGYKGGGVAYQGLVRSRPADGVGIGVSSATLAEGKVETAVEIFYKCRFNARTTIQPDLQWVRRPAGDGRSALAAGLRLAEEF